jgi:hypothetical protein
MKQLLTSCAVLCSLPILSFAADILVPSGSTVIAGWTFDGVTLSSTPTTNISAGPADLGAQPLGSEATGVHASASAVFSTPAGNGSAKSFSSNNWATGDYYQFALNATGFDHIHVTFGQFRSGTGPADFKLAYSTDGVAFTDFSGGSYTVLSTPSWSASATLFRSETLYSFDLSSVLALNNDPSIFFRLVNTAATGATAGTNRVDDFTVSDGPVQLVPEPSSFVALLAGVGMLTIARRRRA